jgi:hypothetical protein
LVSCSRPTFTVDRYGDVSEVHYGRVRLDVPATWPVATEVALCPRYGQVGAFIEQAAPQGEHASCPDISSVADGVRIGRLMGYPPTTMGVAPVINGQSLVPVDLHGALGYRGDGFLPRSFWVLVPAAEVRLFFTYSSDPRVAERIVNSVRVA